MKRQNIQNTIAEQAEWWFAHIESGEATPEDITQFETWLDSDQVHRLAYCQTIELCEQMAQMPQLAMLETPARSATNSLSEQPVNLHKESKNWLARFGASLAKPTFAWAGVLAGLAIIATITLMGPNVAPNATREYSTAIGETREITLVDGSTVTLGPRSKIDIAFADIERRVALKGGEAFFSVSANANRPFVVTSGDTKVQVIGTQFNVHSGPTAITVGVLEGRVAVSKYPVSQTDNITANTLVLDAGQQVVSIRRGALQAVAKVAASELASWRNGQLIYDDHSLRHVIADANRYSQHPIIITSEKLEDLPVTAAFGTHQIEKMIAGLEVLLPIKVVRTASGEILLTPAG